LSIFTILKTPVLQSFLGILTKDYQMNIVIINGPNLNLLGKREPEKYGHSSFGDYLTVLSARYPAVSFSYFQSNIEGEIINEIHRAGFDFDGIILNAGGYTHTSVAIHDAIASVRTPVVEVQITNIHAREEFRHASLIARSCKGSIAGFGLDSYRLGVEALVEIIKNNS
jgi:3-dehydroquinate dehydratase-2